MRFNFSSSRKSGSEIKAQIAALNRVMAVVEFSIDGTILDANKNFLDSFGYAIEQIRGQHHSLFVRPAEAAGADYKLFWQKLAGGEVLAAQFRRVSADGRDVWIEGSYNPLLDSRGKVYKVVKFATVITEAKERQADTEGQIAAISKSMAVIEFGLDGTILTANPHFLQSTGYTLGEIKGRHHSLFCPPEVAGSDAYREFWSKLGQGQYDSGQYRRLGKDKRVIWLEASYNPIMDAQGKPAKVVKYATDITQQKAAALLLSSAVDETTVVIEAAKNHDLTQRISLEGKTGGVRELCGNVNSLLDSMSQVMADVSAISHTIKAASLQVSTDSDSLAGRTESQASSLQETAATTEELAASIKQSAAHSRQAAGLGQASRDVAVHGGEIVSQAVDAMEKIESAANSISSIIAMIDEISFQTNLLALNAAVEAARAGDAGRGFAVVASEVRALAKRSSESANGIKALIANSSEQVRSGVKLVQEAGNTLQEIVTAASKVAGTIGEISSASAEQANGVEEMAKTVAHMDEMTQQNSLLAEGSSRLSRDLLANAEALSRMVTAFKTNAVAGPGSTEQRDFAGQIHVQLQRQAPHLTRAAPRLQAVTPAPEPRRIAAGGGGGGWEEF